MRFATVRECASALSLNSRISLQDNLNKAIAERMRRVNNLHRVISVHYTESEGVVKKNCALATIWYEVKQTQSGAGSSAPPSTGD